MNNNLKAVVAYRLSQADEALDLARMAVQKGYWNSAMSRLYYTCFYLIQLFLQSTVFKLIHIQELKQFLVYNSLRKVRLS